MGKLSTFDYSCSLFGCPLAAENKKSQAEKEKDKDCETTKQQVDDATPKRRPGRPSAAAKMTPNPLSPTSPKKQPLPPGMLVFHLILVKSIKIVCAI